MRTRKFGAMRTGLRRGFGCLLLIVAMAGSAEAGVLARVHTPDFKADLSSAFEGPIPGGYTPMTLNVENRSPVEQRYSIRCSSDLGYGMDQARLEFSETFVVAARGSQSFEVMVPIVDYPNSNSVGYYYGLQLHGQLYTPDGANDFRMDWHGDFVPMASSSALFEVLKKHLDDSRMHTYIVFEPAELPADWRAYVGLKDVFFLASEWQALSDGQRTALLQWAALGGRLNIQTDLNEHSHASFKPFGHPKLQSVRVEHGLGVLRLIYRDLDQAVERAQNENDTPEGELFDELHLDSYVDLNSRSYIGYQLAVIAFVVCIGPFNIMYLCRAPHRLRLFFTTPLIAASFSALVLLYALARDGIGGSGHRFTLSIFMPEMRSLLEVQAQVSMTGMLVGREFSVASDAAVLPLNVLGERSLTERLVRSLRNGVHSGDWFRSRWGQGQLIVQASPSRERLLIEVGRDGDTLRARSEINAILEDLHYVDEKGNLWFVDRLGLGESKEMTLVSSRRLPKLEPWHRMLTLRNGSDATDTIQWSKNTFVAHMESVARPEIETLTSIDRERGARLAFGHAVVSRGKAEGGRP